MSDTAKQPQNTVSLVIDAGGDFSFNDTLEASDPKAAREAGRAIANFALGLFAVPRRKRRAGGEDTKQET